MAVPSFSTAATTLSLAEQLDSINFESHAPYPEIFDSDLPSMSLAWVKNLFSRSGKLSEKISVRHEYSRTSSDLESLASTDAGTLLDDDSNNEKIQRRSPAVDARVISDAIIGLSDGLTVPFALTAGLSALGDTRVVIFGGASELIAGAISMGLGGYLGAKSEEYVSLHWSLNPELTIFSGNLTASHSHSPRTKSQLLRQQQLHPSPKF